MRFGLILVILLKMKIVYVLAVVLFGAIAWYHLHNKPGLITVAQNDSLFFTPVVKDSIMSDQKTKDYSTKYFPEFEAISPPVSNTDSSPLRH